MSPRLPKNATICRLLGLEEDTEEQLPRGEVVVIRDHIPGWVTRATHFGVNGPPKDQLYWIDFDPKWKM